MLSGFVVVNCIPINSFVGVGVSVGVDIFKGSDKVSFCLLLDDKHG
jgi:hypothetical protein